ncbi:hypothetical protein PG984_016217 [Apiospora sp. TS-2023a]
MPKYLVRTTSNIRRTPKSLATVRLQPTESALDLQSPLAPKPIMSSLLELDGFSQPILVCGIADKGVAGPCWGEVDTLQFDYDSLEEDNKTLREDKENPIADYQELYAQKADQQARHQVRIHDLKKACAGFLKSLSASKSNKTSFGGSATRAIQSYYSPEQAVGSAIGVALNQALNEFAASFPRKSGAQWDDQFGFIKAHLFFKMAAKEEADEIPGAVPNLNITSERPARWPATALSMSCRSTASLIVFVEYARPRPEVAEMVADELSGRRIAGCRIRVELNETWEPTGHNRSARSTTRNGYGDIVVKQIDSLSHGHACQRRGWRRR